MEGWGPLGTRGKSAQTIGREADSSDYADQKECGFSLLEE